MQRGDLASSAPVFTPLGRGPEPQQLLPAPSGTRSIPGSGESQGEDMVAVARVGAHPTFPSFVYVAEFGKAGDELPPSKRSCHHPRRLRIRWLRPGRGTPFRLPPPKHIRADSSVGRGVLLLQPPVALEREECEGPGFLADDLPDLPWSSSGDSLEDPIREKFRGILTI